MLLGDEGLRCVQSGDAEGLRRLIQGFRWWRAGMPRGSEQWCRDHDHAHLPACGYRFNAAPGDVYCSGLCAGQLSLFSLIVAAQQAARVSGRR